MGGQGFLFMALVLRMPGPGDAAAVRRLAKLLCAWKFVGQLEPVMHSLGSAQLDGRRLAATLESTYLNGLLNCA